MIVFLTVYLGLIAGRQPIEMRVDPAVKSVQLLLDGTKVDTLAAEPWKAIVDFGPTIQPHELIAVGLDGHGEEIARVSQVLNLPRATAELEVILERDAKGTPRRVQLSGFHVSYADVRRATLKLDVVPLSLDRNYRANLPAIDTKRPHVLAAEMRFADGTVARRELVFGGEFAESMPTQLTPALVTRTAPGADAPPADDCFSSGGAPLRVSNVEKANAIVVIVRDPDPSEVKGALMFTAVIGGTLDTAVMRRTAKFDDTTTMELVSPAADRVVAPDQPTAILFPSFPNPDPKEGLFWFLTSTKIRGTAVDAPRRWADAVAVAAVKAVAGGRRRAVLLVLGNKPDTSYHAPAAVRQYLESIGVPLYVWSVFGNNDRAAAWGKVEDVSTMDKMEAATEAIQHDLDAQRIAWIYADPITALRAQVKPQCGYARLAR
jgi:hypothetical protein